MAALTTRPLEWRGDPTVLVYAVRYALTSRGSHAPELLRQTLAANADQIPAGARTAIVRDVTAWLDAGAGRDSSRLEREPWVMALAALGVRRRPPGPARPAP